MSGIDLGPASAFAKANRTVVEAGGLEIGVFHLDGEFYAYENTCPHMGGPVCQGQILPRVEEVVADDRTSCGMEFSKKITNIICPWHGFEFDISTGRHQGSTRVKLRSVPIEVIDGRLIARPEKKTRAA